MQDFTAGALSTTPARAATCGDPTFDKRIKELVRDWGCDVPPELIEGIMITALKYARDKISIADIKLANRSLNELRYAARKFAPYRHVRKVCVFGSARTSRWFPCCSSRASRHGLTGTARAGWRH